MARIDQRLSKPSSTGGIGNAARKPNSGFSDAVLSSKIAAILNANAPESYKQRALANAPTAKAPEAWWEQALNTLGKPKTLVVASLRRAVDPNANWMRDVRENVGFGKLVEKSDLPDFVKGGIGFIGDVALDPLTYVGVGLADDALKMGGKGANLFFKAAKYSEQVGKTDDAIKFATAGQKAVKGLSNLSGTERQVLRELATSEAQRIGTKSALSSAALKESGGLYLNLPGTGSISNRLRSVVGVSPVTKRQIKLLNQSDALSSIPRSIRKGEELVRGGRLGQALGKTFTAEEKLGFINKLRRGDDPLKAADSFFGLKALNVGPASEVKFAKDAMTAAQRMYDDIEKFGVDWEDVTRAAGGDPNAFARLEAAMGTDKATAAREFSRDLGRLANDVAGVAEGEVGSIPIRDLHAATLRSDELKLKLGQGYGNDTYDLPGAVKGANFEKRALRPGDTFLDKELVAPSAHPEGLSVPDQMERIAQDFWGDDYVKMFNQNFKEATDAQINALSKWVRVASIEKYLRDAGVAKDLYQTVLTGAATKARQNLTKVLNKLPAARETAAGSYMEVENSRQAFEAAEALVAGSKELAAVWRAEARIDRLSRVLLGEDSSDPILKGLYTKLRNAKSAEEAATSLREMQDQLIRSFPDEADQIIAPLREAVDSSFGEVNTAFAQKQKFTKMLDELDANRQKVVDYHNARSESIREYADLLTRQADLRRITEKMMAEINNPGMSPVERDALTAEMQSNLKGLTDNLNKMREMRAYLEAPDLMSGPPRKGSFKAGQGLNDKGQVVSAGTVQTSTVATGALGGETDIALLFFLKHPNVDSDAAGLRGLINKASTYDDLTVKQREAVIKEANRIIDDLQRQVESYDAALRRRIETSPQMGLRQANAELDRIAARLQELGQDEYVAYLGDLKARLPEVDAKGNLVHVLVTDDIRNAMEFAQNEIAMGWGSTKNFEWAVDSTSKEGLLDFYLAHRADEILKLADQRGLLDEADQEISEILDLRQEIKSVLDDVMENNRNIEEGEWAFDVASADAARYGDDELVTSESIRTLNALVEQKFLEEAREITLGPQKLTWSKSRWSHGGVAQRPIDLNVSFGGTNFANADSVAGMHWIASDVDSQGYASHAVAQMRKKRMPSKYTTAERIRRGEDPDEIFRSMKESDPLDPIVVNAQLSPKNTLVYGPEGIDLEFGRNFNFDVLGPGEWIGGRAKYFGDVLRDGLKTRKLNRSMVDSLKSPEQKQFWNTVFDVFDDTNDANEALRRAAALFENDPTLFEKKTGLRAQYRRSEEYEDKLADFIARDLLAASSVKKHPILTRLNTDLIVDLSKSYNETLKAMGYDSIAYVHGSDSGWAVIAIDPAIVKISSVEGKTEGLKRIVKIYDKEGKHFTSVLAKDRKAAAWDLFDSQEAVAKQMLSRNEKLIAKIDDAREKVGSAIDRSTASWEDAGSRLNSDRVALEEAQTRVVDQYREIIDQRTNTYQTEVDYRRKAVRYGEQIEQRTAMYEAEMAQAQAQGVAANQALEDLRSELGVLSLERDYAAAQADLVKANREVLTIEKAAVKLRSKSMDTEIIRVLENGFSQLRIGSQAPDHIVEAIQMMTKVRDPREMGIFLKTFDWLTQAFKSWAIATPGFHFRNFMGGVFNNFLAGVEMSSYKQFRKADQLFQRTLATGADRSAAYAAIGKRYGELVQEAYQVAERSYAFGMPGQIGSTGIEAGIGDSQISWRKAITAKGKRNFVIDNPATRLNLHASEYVERQLRGTLAFDYAMKGAGKDEALEAVYKFHFNYDDLSSTEKNVAKRVMPFYTWTRKNLPLQIEMLLQKPQYYANIGFFKNEMEQYSEKEALTPAWFAKTLNIRMPFKNPMGEQMYMMPQLPPTDLQRLTNPREFLGMINPLIKVPIEAATQKKLYNDVPFKEGYVPVPSAWNKLGIGPIMQMAGFARPDKDGNLVARDSDLYAVESFMPLLGRARRLFPSDSQESEKKYSNRVLLSWANAIFGLGLTANTESDQSGELYRRTKELDKINKELGTMGYGGFKTLTRDVATKQKPVKGEKSPYLIVATPKGGAGSSYAPRKEGQSGSEALTAALNKLKNSKSASVALQETIANLQNSRTK